MSEVGVDMGHLKKSHGNMYPWVTHMIAHVGGECPHKCSYCYVNGSEGQTRSLRYTGPIHIIPGSLETDLGQGNVIFVDHMNDLWAEPVPDVVIRDVLLHCWQYPKNRYVFQTKNPERYEQFKLFIPPTALLGTTIETNRVLPYSFTVAPTPHRRYMAMARLLNFDRFVTIEPVVDFDTTTLLDWIQLINPKFVNIGADSKGHGLMEPSKQKILDLISGLRGLGIEIREKHNLERIIGPLEELPSAIQQAG